VPEDAASDPIDLGDDHTLTLRRWPGEPVDEVNRWHSASYTHLTPDGRPCSGHITLDVPAMAALWPTVERWTVEAWEPLTLSPSLLCRSCGDHGFIRAGAWVRA
jgi:hypothetical protein